MQTYVLSKEAEKDLREIAQYTLNEWGEPAFQKYKGGLSKKFNDIGKNLVVERRFSKNFPQLLVSKYRHHFIFYMIEGVETPVIIGVIQPPPFSKGDRGGLGLGYKIKRNDE